MAFAEHCAAHIGDFALVGLAAIATVTHDRIESARWSTRLRRSREVERSGSAAGNRDCPFGN